MAIRFKANVANLKPGPYAWTVYFTTEFTN